MTCEDIARRDLVARYVAGRLGPEETEAFEGHYFGCDACWAEVREAAELHGSLASSDSPAAVAAGTDRDDPATRPGRGSRPRWRVWAPAAAAAVVAVVLLAVGDWPGGTAPATPDGTRGAGSPMALEAVTEGGGVRLSWIPVDAAERYTVRAFTAEGELVLQTETDGATLFLTPDHLPGTTPADTAPLYLRVRALDAVGRVRGESPLVAVPRPRPAPPPGP